MSPLMEADLVDREPQNGDELAEKMELLLVQARDLHDCLLVPVTCPCGSKMPLFRTVRCLDCGVYLCEPCAARHFGKVAA